jgi:hypothetical protein
MIEGDYLFAFFKIAGNLAKSGIACYYPQFAA